MRHFSNVSDGTSMFEDDDGQAFATLDNAKAAAAVVAAELPGGSGEAGNDVAIGPIEG